jgi:hypothetical protein
LPPGASCAHLGAILEPSWGHFGTLSGTLLKVSANTALRPLSDRSQTAFAHGEVLSDRSQTAVLVAPSYPRNADKTWFGIHTIRTRIVSGSFGPFRGSSTSPLHPSTSPLHFTTSPIHFTPLHFTTSLHHFTHPLHHFTLPLHHFTSPLHPSTSPHFTSPLHFTTSPIHFTTSPFHFTTSLHHFTHPRPPLPPEGAKRNAGQFSAATLPPNPSSEKASKAAPPSYPSNADKTWFGIPAVRTRIVFRGQFRSKLLFFRVCWHDASDIRRKD